MLNLNTFKLINFLAFFTNLFKLNNNNNKNNTKPK